MRAWFIIFLILMIVQIPVYAKDKAPKDYIPNVFIYKIPDEESESDDISKNELNTNTAVKTDTLKAEIQYFDNLDVVNLDKSVDAKKINLSKPQKISATKHQTYSLNRPLKQPYAPVKSQYKGIEESWISAYNRKYEEKLGNFSIGSSYSSGLSSLSTLEYSSGLFTRYQKKKFALTTEFSREQSPAFGYDANIFSFAPEYRLNKSITLKNVLTTNLTTNRKTNELVLMLTPFAYKNNDRLNLEFSAGQTYDEDNSVLKSKFKFKTNFKL